MTDFALTATRMTEGVWEGRIDWSGTGEPPPPEIVVTHRQAEIAGVETARQPDGGWTLRVPIPVRLLSDGFQTFVITDGRTGARLGDFAIACGDALEADLRAEVELLRAELDMLKRAFRRHCVEAG